MSLSIIIPAYNNLERAMNCLNSLRYFAAAAEHEYIIADDASPDVRLDLLIPACAAKVVRSETNGGYCVNANFGAARATGDILLFANHDICAASGVSEAWDNAILAAFQDTSIGVVGARLLFPDGKIQSAGGAFDGHCQPYHPNLGWSIITHPEVNTPKVVSWVTGGALATRRDVFQQLNGFDEGYYRGYFEDPDYCLRVRELGLQVWYEPRATFVHDVGSTGGNPHMMNNARRFKALWVDSGKIKPDTQMIYERWW